MQQGMLRKTLKIPIKHCSATLFYDYIYKNGSSFLYYFTIRSYIPYPTHLLQRGRPSVYVRTPFLPMQPTEVCFELDQQSNPRYNTISGILALSEESICIMGQMADL